MPAITQINSGLQPHWNYDSFSIAGRVIGGGTGFMNLVGGKVTITPSGTPMNPATPPSVTINEDMNFMFGTTDLSLRFHNNPPFVRRFYNSTERLHDGSGNSTDSLPRHVSLVGRHWMLNQEHSIIHPGTDGEDAIEIGPTGERNKWVYSSASGDTESFTRPDGVQKVLIRSKANDTFDLVMPDYTTFRFVKKDEVPGNDLYYHRLEYIECKNGTRQYIEWENKGTGYGDPEISRYRIKEIAVSTDQGNRKTPLIKFRYTSWEDTGNSDAFHLIRTMQDMSGREWRYEYDDAARLIKVTYPDGATHEYAYTLVGSDVVDNYLLTEITDPNRSEWEVSYASKYWRIDNDSSSSTDYHTTSYAWSVVDAYTLPSGFVASGSGYTAGGTYRTIKCVKTDPESKTWDYHHNCLHGPGNIGNLMSREDPLDNKWGYFWDDPASDRTNDNLVYLAALPLVATNADDVQRSEYTTTGNGFKLVSKTYPMRGTNPNYGVKGSVQNAQTVEYTYTSGESTVAKIKQHQNFSTPAYIGDADPSPGIGLDDLTPGGTFTGGSDEQFTVVIKTAAMPDRFNWTSSAGGSGSGINITGAAQTLQNGVTVTFGATTGHTPGDTWTFTASAARTDFFSETSHTYDDNHNLVKSVSGVNPDAPPDDRREHLSLDLTTYMEYDGNGNLIRTTDARGNSSSYFYNQMGAMTRSANPLGSVARQSWDETNTRLQSTTDALGNVTQYSYDPVGQLVAVRNANGDVSKTQYDSNGNVIGRADPRGHSGYMEFDKKNRLVKTVSPSGVVRELTLAKTGQVLLEKTTYWDEDYSTNEQVIYRRTFYDNAGKVTARSLPSSTDHGTDPDTWEQNNKLAAKYTYDANGNVLTTVDRYGQTSTNTYDWANRRETTRPPNVPDTTSGEYIRTTYKTIYSGPMGRVSEEQVQEETSSNGGQNWSVTRSYYFIKKHTYDRAGRTIVVETPTHTMLGTSYDAFQDTYYDENGNVTQRQLRRVKQSDPTDIVTWPTYMEYDAASRVVKESRLVSTDSDSYDRVETTYEYDFAGRRISTNRGGLLIQVVRDTVGRITEVRSGSSCGCGGGGAAPVAAAAVTEEPSTRLVVRYGYDESGNRTEYSDPAGVFASVTHDAENRPVAVTDRAGRVTRSRYWPTGQLKQRIGPDGSFTGYEYDIEGRNTKIWASVPELNSAQAAGPFGKSEDCALIKTIEYYRGTAMPSGSGQNISWSGTQINSGAYVSAVRTFTYKGAGPVYYDMVYTTNARGQAEKTYFIDDDDSTTRTTTHFYTWRDKVRRITHPDTNSLDYEYNDYLQLTKEKLQGNDEYYEFDWCLCGALKRHRYHYIDSQDDAQDMDWTLTTDKLGRVEKEYYPYAIAKQGGDEYRSLLFEYDTASRRTAFSDPTFGHTCPDTSGWSGHVEPDDEDNWAFDEPLRYLFAAEGNLRALGRVKGSGIREGEGEPYFVKRDEAGRVTSVIYPNKTSTQKPEYEMRYEYAADGRVAQTALVRMWGADTSEYGPERFVVQYIYDKAGRLVRKVVRDNSVQDSAVRYETSHEFDGMGRMTRERVLKRVEESGVERMNVLEDKRTTYDLGNNPTEVKHYDNVGWAYTETRTYARGYQLVDFSTQAALGVSVSTAGSYTYDANNNLTGTKKLDVTRGATQLSYRAQWTFTYDRKNRLKSHTNTNASNVRGNLWYDGRGRVWQRWNDNSSTEDWDATLKRFVYDGGALVQEHEFDVAEVEDEWVYTYDDLTRDYLRQPAGLRQRQRSGGNDTDYYVEANSGALEFKTERDPVSEAIARTERTASLNQISGATFTSGLSNLATTNNYIEMYGGGTSGASAGFDALIKRGARHFLAAAQVFTSRTGNVPYALPAQITKSSTPLIQEDQEDQPTEPLVPERCNYYNCPNTHCAPGTPQFGSCWYGTPEEPDGSLPCVDFKMPLDCKKCDGIQCPEDRRYPCYSIAQYEASWATNPADISGGQTCFLDPNDTSLRDWLIAKAQVIKLKMNVIATIRFGGELGGPCIPDPELRECIETIGLLAGIVCNCNACLDREGLFGVTVCPIGICICTHNIKKEIERKGFSQTFDKFFERILLHEMVHWCLACHFKRPTLDDPARFDEATAASACERECYKDEYLEGGAQGHDPDWMRGPQYCGICEGSGAWGLNGGSEV